MHKTLLILLLAGFAYSQESVSLWEGKMGGLDDTHLSQYLAKNDFQDMHGCFTDKDNCVSICGGLDEVWHTTGTVRLMHEYIVSGDRYMVFIASNALNITKTAGSYTTYITTVNLNSNVWAVNLINKCYIGDSSGERWIFDGTSLTMSTEVPQCKYALAAYGKIFCINITGNTSRVRYCKIGDANNFPGDFWIDINKGDGEELTGGFLARGDVYVTKPHTLAKLLYITDNTNVNPMDDYQVLTKEIGCVSQNSIRELNNKWYWAFENGIIQFDGVSLNLISTKIQNTIDNMQELSSAEKYWVVTSSIDFAKKAGWMNISTMTTLGSIVGVSTNGAIDQSQTAIGNGNALLFSTNTSFVTYQTFKPLYSGILKSIQLYVEVGFGADVYIYGSDVSTSAIVTSSQLFGWDKIIPVNIYVTSGTVYKIYVNNVTSPQVIWYGSNDDGYSRGSACVDGVVTTRDLAFRTFMSSYEYISEQKNVIADTNETFNMWQKLEVTGTDLSSMNLSYRTGDTQAILSAMPWTSISNYATLFSTISPWVQWKSSLWKSTACAISEVKTSYFVTNNANYLSSGVEFDEQRYYLGFTKKPATTPNWISVWQDKIGEWTQIKNLNITAMGTYKYGIYWGTYDGKLYQYSYDLTDFDGTAIHPYFQTPDFGLNIRDCLYRELWLHYEPTTLYSNLTLEEYINKGATAHKSPSLSLEAFDNYANLTIRKKIDSDLINKGYRCINFKVTDFVKFDRLDFIWERFNER